MYSLLSVCAARACLRASAVDELCVDCDGDRPTLVLLHPATAMWRAYTRLLERQPLFTKALTASTLLGAGDVLGQMFLEPRKEGEPRVRYLAQ